MKGIIFNLFQEIFTTDKGEDAWDAVLRDARLEGAYTSLGNYPVEEFGKIIASASTQLGMKPEATVRWFGRRAMPLLARTYPALFAPFKDTRSFLLSLNEIIHPEVRKLYPGAEVPEFRYAEPEPGVLRMEYRSGRRLCAFAEGLIDGAADHFGDRITRTQARCQNRGDEACEFVITFEAPHS